MLLAKRYQDSHINAFVYLFIRVYTSPATRLRQIYLFGSKFKIDLYFLKIFKIVRSTQFFLSQQIYKL
ncbi:hypothetical protein AFK67_14535 [Cronobacter dublinensis subsp. dublinensis LMG 23823]|nr:hypothetical protein AFK67_14535 [Cronobacter dublinensis subsp. dublinensis LMG 23823]